MTDSPPDDAPETPPRVDDEVSRRRLIRWIAVLAFAVPVVVEALTFGNIIGDELLPGGDSDGDQPPGTPTPTDHPEAVGVGDELLPETVAIETITTSELRRRENGRTYVLDVEVANDGEEPVELQLRTLRLRDGGTVDGVSSTGSVEPGTERTVTAAWSLPDDGVPGAVQAIVMRDGETVVEAFVALERPG